MNNFFFKKSALSISFVIILLGCLAACSTVSNKNVIPLKKEKLYFSKEPVSTQTGVASFYAGRWIGRLTANGERYHRHDFTAAHRKLPFGTFVRVTNLRNHQSVIVRINNRGPYVRGRILDLSFDAAEKLGMLQSGITKVQIEVLERKSSQEEAIQFIQKQCSHTH